MKWSFLCVLVKTVSDLWFWHVPGPVLSLRTVPPNSFSAESRLLAGGSRTFFCTRWVALRVSLAVRRPRTNGEGHTSVWKRTRHPITYLVVTKLSCLMRFDTLIRSMALHFWKCDFIHMQRPCGPELTSCSTPSHLPIELQKSQNISPHVSLGTWIQKLQPIT